MSRTKRLTEAERMEITREAAEGLSTFELAARFGVTSRAVQYTLKRHERRTRPAGRQGQPDGAATERGEDARCWLRFPLLFFQRPAAEMELVFVAIIGLRMVDRKLTC